MNNLNLQNAVSPRRRQENLMHWLITIILFITLIAILETVSLLQKDNPRMISRVRENGLNSVIFSYRDTVKIDSVSDLEYPKLMRHLHMNSSD